MKKTIIVTILFPILLCSCSSRTKNIFFSEAKLKSFGVSELPRPSGDIMRIDDDLAHFYSNDTFGEYVKSVYKYLLDNNLYYAGTYVIDGFEAEMFPNYIYEPIDDSYDFYKEEHHFIYSTKSELNDGKLDPCYEINLSHFDKKTLPFSLFQYDSSIQLVDTNIIKYIK